ncbi:hypothetical protein PybrP1_012187 [[Pythium] brassicae (nom. inval.)]|nr:hypothetical protein PybrP1_012187 [[Pythium] brassicae (nom. inval.)]
MRAGAPYTSASRRGGRGGAGARRKAVAESDPKTQLFAEWRAHEEECAARVLQRQVRAFLSRGFMARLLTEVYEKQYDPIEKRYFYVNTVTNASTWEKPRVLAMFLAPDRDVAAKKVALTPAEAAQRIQRCARAFLALRSMKLLVRETYMKLFNTATRSFYYLNTKTGVVAERKPAFLRDDEDLDIEQFHFRKAVAKLTTATNLYGSGIIGRFCGILCVLSDGRTLPSEEAARSAHAVCNYAASRIPFQVVLASEKFFAPIALAAGRASGGVAFDVPDFALCALDEAQFQVIAGTNIVPLRFELNDRKMGCADASQGGVRVDDPIEVVGHPYGKLQVLHERKLRKMTPNSINPTRFQYDAPTEGGSAGSAVFTRGGKLLGVQAFLPLKEVPHECWHIKPILDAATQLVTPPEPFLLVSCVASQEVHVYWQIRRWYKPLRGLDVHFELEICCHADNSAPHPDRFVCVYSGTKRSRQVGSLRSDTLYSVRCRAVNAMRKGSWSSVMRFMTLPSPSMAWRLKHCTTLTEAVKHMRRHGDQDQHVHLKSVQWIYACLQTANGDEEQSERCETELAHCDGLELLFDSLAWFPEATANILGTLHVLTHLTRLQQRTHRLAGSLRRMQQLCALLDANAPTLGKSAAQEEREGALVPEKDADELRVPIAIVALLGRVLEQNPSAKQVARVCGVVPLVLSLLDRDSFRHQGVVAAECCYLLGVYSHDNGRWGIVDANGLALLRDILEAYHHDSKVLYWALVALGNVASGCDADQRRALDAASARLLLVDSVCACRAHFLTRLRELEIDAAAARARLAHLQATHIGEEMRNEMDASEHEVQALDAVRAAARDHNVGDAADYALRYLLTPAQRRVQQASTHIMRRFLHRKLAVAHQKWCEATVYERQRAIFRRFLTTVTSRQLGAAFRRWDRVVRELRRHKSVLQTIGSGLAIDLTKKRRERYRMLVLQK